MLDRWRTSLAPFPIGARKTKQLSTGPMTRFAAFKMVQWQARKAGLLTPIC